MVELGNQMYAGRMENHIVQFRQQHVRFADSDESVVFRAASGKGYIWHGQNEHYVWDMANCLCKVGFRIVLCGFVSCMRVRNAPMLR